MSKDAAPRYREFPLTRWSLVDRAASVSREAGFKALDELVNSYLPALTAHLVTMRRLSRDRAEDIVQGFVCGKILQGDLLARADPRRGKFRTFLLTSLERYLASVIRRETAQKRSPGPGMIDDIDDHAHALAAPPGERAVFDRAWAGRVLALAIERFRRECEKAGKSVYREVFECRILAPILDGECAVPYSELMRRFGFRSPSHASNTLVTAKRMFARALTEVVMDYVGDEAEVQAEIEELRAILAGDP